MLPLHGDLPSEEQDRAVQPSSRPKLILSTNVAESSITIDGVTVVIDSGLARIATDNPDTGLPTLEVRRISKASAAQRAGRAGRTRPGRAIRLYSIDDFARRPDQDVPEIERARISQTLFELQAIGVDDLAWLTPPPDGALQTRENCWTARRRQLCPGNGEGSLHPRLSRVTVRLPSAASGGSLQDRCRSQRGRSYGPLDLLHEAARSLSPKAEQIERQIRPHCAAPPRYGKADIQMSILTGYPDRVARRQSPRGGQLCNGRPVQFADWDSDLLVAVDVEERREAGLRSCGRMLNRARMAPSICFRIESGRETNLWNRAADA